MGEKSILVIGAGIGGLAAGCYARMHGYKAAIFEAHNQPGGVCTSWRRKGYTFDGCIHHLAGCNDGSAIGRIWEDLGALPRPVLYPEDLVRVEGVDGKAVTVYTDLERLEEELGCSGSGSGAPAFRVAR
jgi:phytoene dehydrogenase-like protein